MIINFRNKVEEISLFTSTMYLENDLEKAKKAKNDKHYSFENIWSPRFYDLDEESIMSDRVATELLRYYRSILDNYFRENRTINDNQVREILENNIHTLAMIASSMCLKHELENEITKINNLNKDPKDEWIPKFYDIKGKEIDESKVGLDIMEKYILCVKILCQHLSVEYKEEYVLDNIHDLAMNAAKIYYNAVYPNAYYLQEYGTAFNISAAYNSSLCAIVKHLKGDEQITIRYDKPIDNEPNPILK